MSQTIDEKVVEMRFDNKDFESNVSTSMSTLDKLKEKLNFGGMASALDDLGKAGNSISFGGLSGAIDTINDRFSVMGTIASRVLENIADSAYNAGKNLVMSLSTEQITAGWNKYADKTSAVQTIMAATAKDFDNTSEQMEYVNAQLEKLNWFTDETSYNFLDMASNIGKFTSNNVDLETAVTAMQGISTWAAISGANTNEASRAMYNLSQAIAVGSVKLIDWKSIENANMATAEFKQTVIDTAVSVGTLKDKGNGLYETMKGNEVSVSNFNSALSDAWFTSEVLLTSLDKYGGFTDKLYEMSEVTGKTATELLQDLEQYQNGTLDLAEYASATGADVQELSALFAELGDETMALGQKSFRAAQEAKTFQEAIDATKDAVSTGWMNTFELIFGNYEEAKVLWTDVANELYDVFAASAEARNELLGEWKDAGGRDMLLEAAANAWEALKNAILPLKGAFRDVFPEITSEQLLSMTEALRDFTSNLGFSESTAANLRSTFKGLFSILDIVGQALSAVGRTLSPLLGLLFKGSDAILDFTGGIGDSIYEFAQSAKESDLFYNALQKVVGILKTAKDKVSEFVKMLYDGFTQITGMTPEEVFNKIKDAVGSAVDKIKEFLGVASEKTDISGFEAAHSIFEHIHEIIQKIVEVLKGVKDKLKEMVNLDSITSGLQGLWDILCAIGKGIGTVLGGIWEGVKIVVGDIAEGLSNANFDGLTDLASGGVLVAIGMAIKNFVDSLSGIGSTFEGITDALNSVKGVLEAYQNSIKANTILKIAGAVGILAVSILILSTIDSGKLLAASTAMGVMMNELVGSMQTVNNSLTKTKGLKTAALAMIGMSVALLIMASAMKKVGELDWDQIAKGLIGLAGSMAMLVKAVDKLQGMDSGAMKSSIAMIAMGVAINLMAKALEKIGSLDWGQIGKGLAGMGGVLIEIAGFSKLMENSGLSISSGVAMIAIAASMLIFKKALEGFSELDWSQIGRGLAGMGGVLLELGIFSKIAGGSKMLGMAVSMAVIGASMKLFASALKDFSTMKWDEIARGLVAMGGALAEVTIAMNLFPTNTFGSAAGLVIVGAALLIVANALKSFGSMQWDEIGRGLVAMGGALVELVIALNLMAGTLPGSAALLVAAGALAILAPVLGIFGQMSWEEIGHGLVLLGGALAIVVAAAWLVSPVVVPLLALSGALLAIGVAVGLVGAGMFAFGAGVTALAVGLTVLAAGGSAAAVVIAESLTIILTSLLTLLPTLATALAESIGAFASSLITVMPTIMGAVTVILSGVLQAIIEITPQIVEALGVILDGLIDLIIEYVPKIADAALKVILGILKAIADNLPDIIAAGVDIIVALLEGIAEAIPRIAEAAVDIITAFIQAIADSAVSLADAGMQAMISFLNGMADTIRKNTKPLIEAMNNLIMALLEAAVEVVKGNFDLFKSIGQKLMENEFIAGIVSKASELISSVQEFLTNMVETIKEKFEEFKKKGEELITNIKDGIDSKIEAVKTAVGEFVTGLVEKIKEKVEEFKQAGADAIQGFIDGITGGFQDLMDAGAQMGDNLLNGAKDFLGIQSPSREFQEVGNYSVEGMVNGISDKLGDVKNAAVEMASNLLNGVSDKAGELWNTGKDFIDNLTGGVNKNGKDVAKAAKNVASEASGSLSKTSGEFKTAGIGLISGAVKGFASKLPDAKATAGNVATTTLSKFTEKSGSFKNAGSGFMTNAVKGISSKISSIRTASANNASTALGKFKDKYDGFYSAGANVQNGFIKGMKSKISALAKTASSLAKKALSSAKDALGIKSPSREFIKVGMYSVQGFANGLSQYAGLVSDGAKDLGRSAVDSMSDAISKIRNAIDVNESDFNPVIRPIVDLSEVRASSETLKGLFGNQSIALSSNIGAISSMMGNLQNGNDNKEVITAINKLRKGLEGVRGDTYNVNGITYDDGSEVQNAVRALIRATKVERRA